MLEGANLKLLSVFCNVNGITRTKIIDEILAERTDLDQLTFLCTHGFLQSTKEEIHDAVEGCFTEQLVQTTDRQLLSLRALE